MKTQITDYFVRQLVLLQKRFPTIIKDCQAELSQFDVESATALGRGIFKLRARNSDIPCGKSGGYRLVVFYATQKQIVVPLLVYSKRDQENVSKVEIKIALKLVLIEL